MGKDALRGNPIYRFRGDTAPDQITLLGLEGSGFTWVLSISAERDPTGAPLIEIAGDVIHQGPPCIVQFPWTEMQADQAPGEYWYDVEQQDSEGRILTILKNAYVFPQDITK